MDYLDVDDLEHEVDLDSSDDEEAGSATPETRAAARKSKAAAKAEDRSTMLEYPLSMPYECESIDEFDERLLSIASRLVACVKARDWDIGLIQWNHRLQCLLSLKYPLKRSTRARLARLYYHIAVLPGLEQRYVTTAANMCMTLITPKKRLTSEHLLLPWRPLYTLLVKELFPKTRKVFHTNVSETLLDLAETAQRFFDPDQTEEMLAAFLPRMDGASLNSVIATQAFLVHFLPLSHPQRWLPAMFRLWESFSSTLFDDQMLDLLARLAEMHVTDPSTSSQRSRSKVARLADLVEATGKGKSVADLEAAEKQLQDEYEKADEGSAQPAGLFKEIGIFTEEQFALIMTKCLRSAGVPVGTNKAANAALLGQSAVAARTGADAQANANTLKMKKPSDKLHSLAVIIAYSIAPDAPAADASPSTTTATPTPASASPQLGPTAAPQSTFVGGSKALDQLAKLIQACESYFHPSNWGMWQISLTNFVQSLTWEFLKRWKDEQKSDCKTPASFRLTPTLRREFCLTLRSVCLMSMFAKDPMSVASSQSSLKRMSLLEPQLILPAVLERSFSSLEALETTARTTAILTALSTLAMPLVSRENWAPGGKHLPALLHLCLPGIDLNDPLKTMATSMFILSSLLTVKLDDLTRPEVTTAAAALPPAPGRGDAQEDTAMEIDGEEEPALTLAEEDEALRMSTAELEDWVVTFFRRVIALFEALPEEGKGGRTGGKSEEHVINTVLAACDTVCTALSEHFFDLAFKIVTEYCTTTVNATSVRVLGSLVSCFARANSKKVLDRLLPMCAERVEVELAHGASSARTTSTSVPVASDAALHWNLSILVGAMSNAGVALLPHRARLMKLLVVVSERTRTERGYAFASRLVQRILSSLVSIYPIEQRGWNPDEWESQEMQCRSHLQWGKLYTAKDVKLTWHVPNDEEIDFALEVLNKIVGANLDVVERLQAQGVARDKVWSNDFCRSLTIARGAFVAMAHVVEEPERGGGAQAMDSGDEVEEFIQLPPRFKAGFILTDPTDKRHQAVTAFRARFGTLMHRAAQSTQESAAEDQIDCVKLLVRSIRTYMTTYAYSVDDFRSHARSLSFFKAVGKMFAKQKVYPRVYWVRRAAHYHTSRARLASFHRRRAPLDDELIADVAELCVSNYVGIRKTAQNSLNEIASFYDGTRVLCLPKLFDAIKPASGASDDRMKGALHVLGSKGFSNLCISDERFTATYAMALLAAQNHSKPSIQKLVRAIIGDLANRLAPAILLPIESAALNEAVALMESEAGYAHVDATLLDAVVEKRSVRLARIDGMYAELTPRLLALAQGADTHWAFQIYAARMLRSLIRTDEPLRPDVAAYLCSQVTSDNPKMRHQAQVAVTQILYIVKMRTLCKDNEALVLGEPKNPLKRTEKLPEHVSKEWSDAHWLGFARGGLDDEVRLHDKSSSGWLVWGNEDTFYAAPPATGSVFEWEAVSAPALEAIRSQATDATWWEALCRHLSQEKDRDYVSADSIDMIKSLFQAYGIELLPLVQPSIEAFVSERDRHKHRAAAELLGGIMRGSKHWPRDAQGTLWTWLGALLPRIFKECTPDSQPAWQMCVEHALLERDPRRAMPLVQYVVNAARDSIGRDMAGVSPWEQSKTQTLLRGAILALGTKFTAWEPDFSRLYTNAFDSDFAEVRMAVSEGLADLDLLQTHPSFGSVEELLVASAEGQGSLFAKPQIYTARLESIAADLTKWRTERRPTSQGTSQYDRAALTSLLWIATTLGDHRRSALAESVIDFLPHIFLMLELHDNAELSATARSVLFRLSAYSWQGQASARLVRKLLEIVKDSKESWRTRLDALPVLQVVFFQNIFYLDAGVVQEIVELLFGLLADPHLEVREMASATLSGIVRCSQRRQIHALRKRFTATILSVKLPKRGTDGFNAALLQLHSGVLGVAALLAAFPYDVPDWMPQLITDTLVHLDDAPPPVSTTVRRSAADFARYHQDTFEADRAAGKFGDHLSEITEWLRGSSSSYLV